MHSPGHVFWLFGLSGSGKSTIAASFEKIMRSSGRCTLALDGDVVRAGMNRDLGFSERDRDENLRRAAEVARLGKHAGLCVIASFITPKEHQRRMIREIVGAGGLSLIYLNASVEVCIARDPKGLYAKACAGRIPDMTGINAPFEPPVFCDLVLNTGVESEQQSRDRLFNFSRGKFGLVRSSEEQVPIVAARVLPLGPLFCPGEARSAGNANFSGSKTRALI